MVGRRGVGQKVEHGRAYQYGSTLRDTGLTALEKIPENGANMLLV